MPDPSATGAILDYPAMIDAAMRGVVTQALRQIVKSGLPGDHHFYVSFATGYPGVRISPQLRERFPHEMTIVMQHQYWDLDIGEEQFSIMLSFNNIPEKLVIPYAALTAFADPSIKFGLQFHTPAPGERAVATVIESSFERETDAETAEDDGAKILSFDAFRKK